MASREFLKILGSARLGDVSAQQKLANAYLTGAFKTPIQPSNALIWLEKSYLSITNQSLGEDLSSTAEISGVLEQIAQIPLSETFNSPSFGFGWDSFWLLAESKEGFEIKFAAKWQIVNLLMNPLNQETQSELEDWLRKRPLTNSVERLSNLNLSEFQKLAKEYLEEIAESESPFTALAKELLIKLQPKNEALSSLWKAWLEDQNEDALISAAELGLTSAKLAL